MEQCHRVLKPGGLLILGYNDTPERKSYPVETDYSRLFEPVVPAIRGIAHFEHPMNDSYAYVFVFGRKGGGGDRPRRLDAFRAVKI